MICFNTNAAPDSNATATLLEGGYNFTCVTPEENAEILSLLRSAAEYPADQRGIALAFFSEATNPSAGISVFDKTIKISPAHKDRGTHRKEVWFMINGGINIPEKVELPDCVNETVKNLAEKPAKQIGTTISDLIHLSFGWISYLSERQKLKYSYGLEELKKSLDAKANAIPLENRIDPDLQVVGQALENAKYCLDKEELREMFANLIAACLDTTKHDKALPMYSMIIKQLTPFDAKVLSTLSDEHVHPICKYGARNQQGVVIMQTNIYLEGVINASKEEIDKRSAAISCLETLGLIKTNYWDQLVTPGLYDRFDKIEAYNDYAVKALSLGGNRRIEITRGHVTLTPIGKQFIEICLPKQQS